MRLAVGGLKDQTESDAYAAWRHFTAERLFRLHLRANHLTVYCMGGRGLFTTLDPCSRCLLPNGTGYRYGTHASAPYQWKSSDAVASTLHLPRLDERGVRVEDYVVPKLELDRSEAHLLQRRV